MSPISLLLVTLHTHYVHLPICHFIFTNGIAHESIPKISTAKFELQVMYGFV
jgi:hypothetical protein